MKLKDMGLLKKKELSVERNEGTDENLLQMVGLDWRLGAVHGGWDGCVGGGGERMVKGWSAAWAWAWAWIAMAPISSHSL